MNEVEVEVSLDLLGELLHLPSDIKVVWVFSDDLRCENFTMILRSKRFTDEAKNKCGKSVVVVRKQAPIVVERIGDYIIDSYGGLKTDAV